MDHRQAGQDELRTNNAFEYAVGVNAASNPKLTPLQALEAPKVEPSSLNSKSGRFDDPAGLL